MKHTIGRIADSLVLPFVSRAVLLTAAMLFAGSGLAAAQSVVFAGAQSSLPFTGLVEPRGLTVDGKGNVFIADSGTKAIVELPRTATGYGPQIVLPVSGLASPFDVAIDKAGNVIIADTGNKPGEGRVLFLPKTDKGYGPQTVLATEDLFLPSQLSFDNAGNLFVVDFSGFVIELPATETAYGTQIKLPFTNEHRDLFGGVAVDRAGDVFVTDFDQGVVLELPKVQAGYGEQVTLPGTLSGPRGVIVDHAGDLFIAASTVKEMRLTSEGYGLPQTVLLKGANYAGALAFDHDENLFVPGARPTSVYELQRKAVDFGGAFLCASGQDTPAPCSRTLTLNIHVRTDGTLGTPKVIASGTQNDDFSLAGASTCTGAFAAGSYCTVAVTFAPKDAGPLAGAVEIVNGSGAILATANLSAIGLAAPNGPPAMQVSPTYLKFGTIGIGETDTLPLSITNSGGGTLTVTTSMTGGNFAVDSSTCTAGVGAGQSCVFQVKFTPTTIAAHYGVLTVHTSAGNASVKLVGIGNGLLVGNGSSLRFGTVVSGSTKVLPLTVTNVGIPNTIKIGTKITVRAGTHPTTTFKILTTTENTCLAGIAAGQSCILPVQFSPTAAGNHADLLTLTPTGYPGLTTAWLVGATP